jgi:hypothetical protein
VHVYTGRCDECGNIVCPLTDITLTGASESFAATSAIPMEESLNDVQASLSDILAEPHGLDNHKSAGAIRFHIVNT